MKHLVVFSMINCLACVPFFSAAQNLVVNGGFENYTNLPTINNQWNYCIGWTNLNGLATATSGYGSPDYYHLQGSGGAKMPNTFWATVLPHSGEAVMGLGFHQNTHEYREYISTELTSPMQIGKEYQISFWMTNGSGNWVNGGASNRLGMRFTTAPLSQALDEVVGGGVPPQIEITGIVWDTVWTEYTFSIIADSAYQHLTLGNFYTNVATTSVQQIAGAWNFSYYYIDDVEVVADTSSIRIISDQTICTGDSVALYVETMQGGLNYDWRSLANLTVSLSTDSVIVVSPATTTDYVVQVGSQPAYVTVHVIAPPILNLGKDTTLCVGEELLLDATASNSTYLWQDNSTNPIYEIKGPGIYNVILSNDCGTASDEIMVEEEGCIVTIPNVFSPNGDAVNERFRPLNLDKEHLILFRIYNRWGQEVFDANENATIGWDGTFMGVAQPQEAYIYVLKYRNRKDASIVMLKGTVTLLR